MHGPRPSSLQKLCLNKNNGRVDGITSGLDFTGQETFKFNVTDNDGKAHTIKSPTAFTYLI
jgi:hypothetical protein